MEADEIQGIGYYTVIGSQAVGPGGRVFAFEPDPTSFGFMKKSVLANKYENVVIEMKALSDKPGTLKLYLSEENRGDHRIYQTGDRDFIEVESVTLDTYLEAHPGRVDFIKIDTQGAEVVILEGMHETLGSNPKLKLAIEFWPHGLDEFGFTATRLLDILEEHGFELSEIGEQEGQVYKTSRAELLKKYTLENKLFTNIFCIRP